jgi:hypothetical protein
MTSELEQEFEQYLPFNSDVPIPPYTNEMDLKTKIKVTQKALRRSIELRNRLTSLINAFYLGKLFNEFESVSEKFRNKQKVSKHYATMAENMYNIFENDPSQLYQTTCLTIQLVKKLKKKQILRLREIVEKNSQLSFDGAQNLGEENC